MKFTHATKEDIDSILTIINQAKSYFKSQNINQWQDGYPNNDSILMDIENNESFVVKEDNKVIATCMVSIQKEPTYQKIYEGKWINTNPYLVIHRVAVRNDFKGKQVASFMINQAIKMYPDIKNVRMDTHHDNLSMQRLLKKNNFKYCGIIYLLSGDPRKAYQKVIER